MKTTGEDRNFSIRLVSRLSYLLIAIIGLGSCGTGSKMRTKVYNCGGYVVTEYPKAGYKKAKERIKMTTQGKKSFKSRKRSNFKV